MTADSPTPPTAPGTGAAARVVSTLPQWASVAPASAPTTIISGGITNALVRVDPPSTRPDLAPVLVRSFGERTELLIDRSAEARALTRLSAAGFGAPVLAEFEGGRIEAFLPARPLTPDEVATRNVGAAVARGVARLHAATRLPLAATLRGPRLWSTFEAWIKLAERLAGGEALAVDGARLRAAAHRVRRATRRLASPLVYCHMDLLPDNILVPDSGWTAPPVDATGAADDTTAAAASPLPPGAGSGLTFIDFEYGRPSPRGFDVGNHWCEYAGLDCEWGRYPGEGVRTAWARAYLTEAARLAGRPPPSDADVAALVVEGDVYSLAAHVFWTAWACVQARVSAVDFDYEAYAASRLHECERRMDAVLAPVEGEGGGWGGVTCCR